MIIISNKIIKILKKIVNNNKIKINNNNLIKLLKKIIPKLIYLIYSNEKLKKCIIKLFMIYKNLF